MKLANFVLLCIYLFSNSVYAGGGIDSLKINSVAFQSGGFFMYADDWENPNACSRNSAVVLLETDRNYDKAYSLLLAAYMAGKAIRGYSDGCASFDGQTYNTIRGFKYLVVK